jgi:5-amino-6-(5-phospho-D-ribitylamino)uracil phosphatase
MKQILQHQRFLIVFDLDGTLLNREHQIEPKTKELIRRLSKMGNIITIASGRPSRSISVFAKELGISVPFIGYNGGAIDNPLDPSFIPFRKFISKDVILGFLRHFGEESFVNLMLEDETDQYYLKDNDSYVNFFHPEGMKLHIGSVIDNLDKDMRTCVLQIKDPSRKDEFKSYLESLDSNMSIRWWMDTHDFGEFFFYDNNKATSIKKLADYYHIDKPHIICFGDAMNDFQMLRSAGISFAMCNGDDELKKAATYVTKYDNCHEGIYHALNELFEIDE